MSTVNTTSRPSGTRAATTEPVLQSFSEQVAPVDPVALFRHAQTSMGTAAYWERPEDGVIIVGMGATQQITLQGIAATTWAFGEARREWQRLTGGAQAFGDVRGGPLLLGGFAFDPLRRPTDVWTGFPAGQLTLPRLLYRQVADRASITYSMVLPPGVATERAFRTLRDTWLAALAGPGVRGAGSDEGGASTGCSDGATNVRYGQNTKVGGSAKSDHPGCPSGDPDPWQQLVAEATQHIRNGQLEKVVLARQVRLPAEAVVDAATALGRLRREMRNGLIFAIASGGRCFLGATPERLVLLRDGQVQTAALAGSRRRGTTMAEDGALEQELLRSGKDRWEHAIVVRALTDGLEAAGVDLLPTPRPTVMKLGSVQHLYTPLSGTVDGGCTILDLLDQLHPSPAVGGYPRAEALAWIREHEGIDRGWYAGPVGWMDAEGNGDFAVGIRSALLDRYGALLFAGCGIMGDSHPEDEFMESELKLRPMLAALQRNDAWIR